MLMGTGVWVPVVHLLRLAQDRGVSETDSERLLVLLGIGSATIRVPMTALADRVGRRVVFSGVLVAYAAADFVMILSTDSYAVLSIYSVCEGGMVGTLLSLMPTLPADVLSADQLAHGTTLVCTFLGVGTTIGPMVAGALFDEFQRYTEALAFAAGCLLMSAMALNCPLPFGGTISGSKPAAVCGMMISSFCSICPTRMLTNSFFKNGVSQAEKKA